MDDQNRTKEQLVEELNKLRRKVECLESKPVNQENVSQHISKALFHSLPDPVVVTDLEGRITFVNPALEQFTGYSTDELIGHSPGILNAEEDHAVIQEDIINCVHRYHKWCGELLQRRKNGSTYIAEFVVFPVIQEDAMPVAYASIQRDITARKQTEKALQEQLHFFQTLIDTIPNAIFYKDLNGTYQGCNKALERQIGYTREDLIGKSVFNLFPPELAQKYDAKDKELFKNHGTQTFEVTIPSPAGSKHTVVLNKATYTDVNGKISGLVCVGNDITEQKQMEQIVKKERERLFSVLDELPAFIYLQSKDYSVPFANRYFWEKFGVPQRGQRCYELICRSKKPCEPCPTFKVFDTKQSQVWEWEDNHGRSYQMSNYPFYDLDGSSLVLVLGMDITEHKKLQAELSQQKERLEEQLHFSTSLNKIAETIIHKEDTQRILDDTAAIIGETLGVDRALIYDIDFEKHHVLGLTEWLNPRTTGITATKDTYNLDLFIDASTYMLNHKKWTESHIDNVSPLAAHDGSGELLHNYMNIKSGLWFPFAFRDRAFYCLVFNQISHRRRWRQKEINFINDAATHVEIAIQKIKFQNERKHAEEALKKSEALYRTIFEHTGTATTISADDSTLSLVNTEFEKLSGYPKQELEGKISWTQFVHKDDLEKMKNYHFMRKIEPHKVPDRFEFRFINKSGSLRNVLMILAQIPGTQRYLSSLLDITEIKRFQDEMTRLERLNLIGQMAAGIGHEVRNPMTTVRGFLQMFGSKKELLTYKKHFDLMIEELDRANEIISQFLSLAKNKPVDKKVQNLNTIIETLHPLMEADAFKFGMQINIDSGEIPYLLLDEKEIRQLILNLTRNGIEAMPPGGVLTVGTFIRNNKVVLAVQDQGGGVDSRVMEKLGTPFVTTKDDGTGLGLSVCYSIATRHNATIDVKTSSAGTTFFVKFEIPSVPS